MFKRIGLFLLTNIAVIAVGMFMLNLLGVGNYITASGINYGELFMFALIFGFTGAFISLLISKPVAKWTTGAQVIKNGGETPTEKWLFEQVSIMAKKEGIGMPEVAIFPSSEVNAFATGFSKNNALVAVSSEMLHVMNPEEIRAVLGHEVAHISNGDMVTMTLLQGVMNTFVIFASRVIGYFIDKVIFKNEGGQGWAYTITVLVLDLLLGILAAMVTAAYSRHREYHADEGGARLSSPQAMKSALMTLGRIHDESLLPKTLTAFGIKGNFSSLLSTHPPIEKRIEHLNNTF